MSDAEELARKDRRRRLIERLNEKEKLIGSQSRARRDQMSEEELAAEIERQRTLNAARGSGGSLLRPTTPYTEAPGKRCSLKPLNYIVSRRGHSRPSLPIYRNRWGRYKPMTRYAAYKPDTGDP